MALSRTDKRLVSDLLDDLLGDKPIPEGTLRFLGGQLRYYSNTGEWLPLPSLPGNPAPASGFPFTFPLLLT